MYRCVCCLSIFHIVITFPLDIKGHVSVLHGSNEWSGYIHADWIATLIYLFCSSHGELIIIAISLDDAG